MFQSAQEFIAIADCNAGETAYQIIQADSAKIVGLFKNDSEFIQLAKVAQSPALALCNLQSKAVATLFNNSDSFMQLAAEADLNLASSLIRNQPNIIFPLFRNKTAIQKLTEANKQIADVLKAAMQCNPKVTKGLLYDLFPPVWEYSDLHNAAELGNLEEITRLIEVEKVNINIKGPSNLTPLHKAIGHPEVIEYLVNKGADIHAQSTHGFTPLHLAISSRNSFSAQKLFDLGADLHILSNSLPRQSPLDWAKSKYRNDELTTYMELHSNKNTRFGAK